MKLSLKTAETETNRKESKWKQHGSVEKARLMSRSKFKSHLGKSPLEFHFLGPLSSVLSLALETGQLNITFRASGTGRILDASQEQPVRGTSMIPRSRGHSWLPLFIQAGPDMAVPPSFLQYLGS